MGEYEYSILHNKIMNADIFQKYEFQNLSPKLLFMYLLALKAQKLQSNGIDNIIIDVYPNKISGLETLNERCQLMFHNLVLEDNTLFYGISYLLETECSDVVSTYKDLYLKGQFLPLIKKIDDDNSFDIVNIRDRNTDWMPKIISIVQNNPTKQHLFVVGVGHHNILKLLLDAQWSLQIQDIEGNFYPYDYVGEYNRYCHPLSHAV
jgi:hypothetical protein